MATQIYNNSKELSYSSSSYGYTYTFTLKITRDVQNISGLYTPTTATCSLKSPQSRWDTSSSYGQLSVTLYWLKEDGTYDSKAVSGEKIYTSAYNTTYSVSVSQDVPHLSDGTSKVYAIGNWYSSASNGYRPASTSLTSSTITLPTIPIYSGFTTHDVKNATQTEITISWSADVEVDLVQYCLNNGTWQTPTETTDNSYTITNLLRGTIYSIKTRIRNASTGLYTISDKLIGITKKNIVKVNDNGIWKNAKPFIDEQYTIPYIKIDGEWD